MFPLVDWTLANLMGIFFFLVIIILGVWVGWIIYKAGKK